MDWDIGRLTSATMNLLDHWAIWWQAFFQPPPQQTCVWLVNPRDRASEVVVPPLWNFIPRKVSAFRLSIGRLSYTGGL